MNKLLLRSVACGAFLALGATTIFHMADDQKDAMDDPFNIAFRQAALASTDDNVVFIDLDRFRDADEFFDFIQHSSAMAPFRSDLMSMGMMSEDPAEHIYDGLYSQAPVTFITNRAPDDCMIVVPPNNRRKAEAFIRAMTGDHFKRHIEYIDENQELSEIKLSDIPDKDFASLIGAHEAGHCESTISELIQSNLTTIPNSTHELEVFADVWAYKSMSELGMPDKVSRIFHAARAQTFGYNPIHGTSYAIEINTILGTSPGDYITEAYEYLSGLDEQDNPRVRYATRMAYGGMLDHRQNTLTREFTQIIHDGLQDLAKRPGYGGLEEYVEKIGQFLRYRPLDDQRPWMENIAPIFESEPQEISSAHAKPKTGMGEETRIASLSYHPQ